MGRCYLIRCLEVDEMNEVQRAVAEVRAARLAREESEEFLDICLELLMEGLVDEDAIEEEAHRIMDGR